MRHLLVSKFSEPDLMFLVCLLILSNHSDNTVPPAPLHVRIGSVLLLYLLCSWCGAVVVELILKLLLEVSLCLNFVPSFQFFLLHNSNAFHGTKLDTPLVFDRCKLVKLPQFFFKV